MKIHPISERVLAVMLCRNMSYRKFAFFVGIPHPTINAWVHRGDRPNADDVAIVADKLGLPLESLAGDGVPISVFPAEQPACESKKVPVITCTGDDVLAEWLGCRAEEAYGIDYKYTVD